MTKRTPSHEGRPPLPQRIPSSVPIRGLTRIARRLHRDRGGGTEVNILPRSPPWVGSFRTRLGLVWVQCETVATDTDSVGLRTRAVHGEAFRQTPHLPEGWVQGADLTMKDSPLSTIGLPSPLPSLRRNGSSRPHLHLPEAQPT